MAGLISAAVSPSWKVSVGSLEHVLYHQIMSWADLHMSNLAASYLLHTCQTLLILPGELVFHCLLSVSSWGCNSPVFLPIYDNFTAL